MKIPAYAKISVLVGLATLAGCTSYSHILYSGPSSSLEMTAADLQGSISRAEENGCRIENVSVGAGHGMGLGLGVGVGVGLNIEDDCPDCAKNKFNHTVKERDEKRVSKSTFAGLALASCPEPNHISARGDRL